jgi:adenylate cyclase
VEKAVPEEPVALHSNERRLAAILAADVAGYSRLMGRNEDETVRDLEAHQAVILPLLAKHGGSIINIAGDGMVAQFPSAVRAVECAVAMQKIMAERNFDVPADRRMLLRIGVNLGDIIHDGTRTYGDGINVAARLEPLAEPGGICISANVRDAIFGKLGLPLRDIGEKTLKNIERPVHIYQIQPAGTRSRRDWLGQGLRQYRRLAPALGLVVLLAAVAGVGVWRFWPLEAAVADPIPLVAVLPFTNAGGDASVDHLGPSFAREVSAMLSSFPRPRIVSAADLPAQKLANPKQAALDLGAGYALGGAVLKSGDKTRVTVQLIDAASDENVWSDSYDFDGEDPIAIQKKTAERVYGALTGINGRFRKIEQAAAWRKPEAALTDYDYVLRSAIFTEKWTFDDNLRARKLLEEGLAHFPDSALLKVYLAWTYQFENEVFGPFANCHETAENQHRLGREAEDAKNKSRYLIFVTRKLMAGAYAWRGEDYERSFHEAEAAVEMAPLDTETRSTAAYYATNAGRLDKGIEWASWAVEHNVHNDPFAKINLAWAYYAAGRNHEAVEVFKGLESLLPAQGAAQYASVGRLEEARAVVTKFLKTGSHSIETESCWPFREPLKQKYLDDLRKAGMPERAERASP